MPKKESLATAHCLEFFNDLFDSVNGTSNRTAVPLRSAITEDSPHHAFWKSAIRMLKDMMFVDPKTGKKSSQVKTIDSWVTTIRSFRALWAKMRKLNYCSLKGRAINQDPLENFFGQIRSLNGRNVNPTVYQFVSAYKTLLVNNLSSRRTIGANCEADSDAHLLTYVQDDTRNEDERVNEDTEIVPFVTERDSDVIKNKTDFHKTVVKAISKKQDIRNCSNCSSIMQDHSATYVEQMTDQLAKTFPKICHMRFLSKKCQESVNVSPPKNVIDCAEHRIFDIIAVGTIRCFITIWCRKVNCILSGHVINDTSDPVCNAAAEMYAKKIKKR